MFTYCCFKTLHVKYALLILHEARNKLRDLPNVRKTTTSITNQITICGKMTMIPPLADKK